MTTVQLSSSTGAVADEIDETPSRSGTGHNLTVLWGAEIAVRGCRGCTRI